MKTSKLRSSGFVLWKAHGDFDHWEYPIAGYPHEYGNPHMIFGAPYSLHPGPSWNSQRWPSTPLRLDEDVIGTGDGWCRPFFLTFMLSSSDFRRFSRHLSPGLLLGDWIRLQTPDPARSAFCFHWGFTSRVVALMASSRFSSITLSEPCDSDNPDPKAPAARHGVMGVPPNGWFIRENPIYKWMMTGGTPMT